jgi:DNA-binding LacI/PurR family transcriptional regulator
MDSFSPRLTTIDLPKRELGAAAAQLLLDRLEKKAGRPRLVTLKNAMRVRESCGCGLKRAGHQDRPRAAAMRARS